jgi:hypothetical protein
MNRFCTIVTRSHLPYARALAESLQASGNSEPLLVLIADTQHASDRIAGSITLGLADLDPAPPQDMTVYFDGFELCNALKPFLVAHALREGAGQVIYLDADLLCVGSFQRVWAAAGPALQLTPHHLTPPGLERSYTKESDVADMGFLNGGFARWQAGPAADAILRWMQQRFPVQGFCDRPNGMFVDQKLLPLLLGYFPGEVGILRDPGLNVAFWNVHERAIVQRGDRYYTGAAEVVFFHLSGYRLNQPTDVCAYLPAATNRAILADAPWFPSVLSRYRELLTRHGAGAPPPAYGFARHETLKLSPALRRHFFRTHSLGTHDPAVLRIRFLDFLRHCRRRVRRFLS